MSEKKIIITSRPNTPALEELVWESCQQEFQKLMKCSVDDLTSLASDLYDPDMELSEVPLPNGKDLREASVGYVIALSAAMGELLNAVKALGGDPSSLIHGIRDRRDQGEQIGRWKIVARDDLQ
jgi:hypothetical protein